METEIYSWKNSLDSLLDELEEIKNTSEEVVIEKNNVDTKQEYIETLEDEIDYYRTKLRDHGYRDDLEPLYDGFED